MTTQALNIIFDGPPGLPDETGGRFVECETDDGKSVNCGEFVDKGNGLWALRITRLPEHPLVFGKWTEEQIHATFDLVKDHDNWKLPIDIWVDVLPLPESVERRLEPEPVSLLGAQLPDGTGRVMTNLPLDELRALIADAVTYYVGGLTEVGHVSGDGGTMLRVMSDGYYHNIGS